MSEVDKEFDRARERSQGRFRSAFEAIFAKYGHIDEEDDIIDLSTGKLIVDNGRMRNADVVELGDLLRYSEKVSSPSGHAHIGTSPRSNYAAHAERDGSLSPELASNAQVARRIYTHGTSGILVTEADTMGLGDGAYSSADSVSSDNEHFDVDFISPKNRLQSSRLALRKRENVDSSAEDEGTPYDYDSSDSMDPGQDTLDAYFTSSIEQYLDKLRQQLSGPPPIERDDSISGDSEPEERGELLQTLDGKRSPGSLRPFHLPSSPRTVSSQTSDDHYILRRQRRYADANSRFRRISAYVDGDEHEYVSESASQTSELDKENPRPAIVRAEHIIYEDQYLAGNLGSKISQLAKSHQSGLYVNSSSAHQLDEVISEEEPMEPSKTYQINTVYDSQTNNIPSTLPMEVLRRPIPVAHWLYESANDDNLQSLQHNNCEYYTHESTAPIVYNTSVLYSQGSSPASYEKTRVYYAGSEVSPRISAPVIRKPQPVAPHVFFDCGNAPPGNDSSIHDRYPGSIYSRTMNEVCNGNNDESRSIYHNFNSKGANDDASIHSGDSLHSLSPTPEQPYFDEITGPGNIYNTTNDYSVYDMQITSKSGSFDQVN
ncbi:hypothetical protein H4R24_004378 [Coemansia sp. RSA 988]|nr:hypothetical protein H4R24_004378 [Coemansia sp. RSA 988]